MSRAALALALVLALTLALAATDQAATDQAATDQAATDQAATDQVSDADLARMAAELVHAAGADGRVRAVARYEPSPGRPGMVRRGRFDRDTRTLHVGTAGPRGPLPRAVVAGVLVHEVAHALSTSDHGDEWRATFERLLVLATQGLGWRVTLECSACPVYGLCSPAQCPGCDWKRCERRPGDARVRSRG